jgi:hypothetical protein
MSWFAFCAAAPPAAGVFRGVNLAISRESKPAQDYARKNISEAQKKIKQRNRGARLADDGARNSARASASGVCGN